MRHPSDIPPAALLPIGLLGLLAGVVAGPVAGVATAVAAAAIALPARAAVRLVPLPVRARRGSTPRRV